MDILDQGLETGHDIVQLKSEDIDDPQPMLNTELIVEDDESMSDDTGVNTLAHAQAILGEDDVQLHFKSDNGVTYRVFHVNHEEQDEGDVSNDYQSSSSHVQPVTAVLASSNVPSNHFYVVGNDVVASSQPPRSLAPRNNLVIDNRTASTTRVRRDDRRRATHNEVERRRRDKINNWIMKLSKIIPDCHFNDNSKTVQSKGGILAKACDYILELRKSEQLLAECLKESEQLKSQLDYVTQQNEKLKIENAILRQPRNNATQQQQRSSTDS